MKVIVAKHAGFCGGVESAVNKALELAKNHEKVWTIGELVHNELVTENLLSNGIFCLADKDVDSLKEGDVALIRAHGIKREVENELRSRGVQLYDATCPVVKRNQKLADERASHGDAIILVGDRSHDEVVGVFSYCRDNAVIIADDELDKFLTELDENLRLDANSEFLKRISTDGKFYRFDGSNGVSVMFQTTVLPEKYEKIRQIIDNFAKNSAKTFGVFNTICYTTKERQEETRALARTCDAVIVLGSKSSANTKRLVQVSKEINPSTYFIQTADQLPSLKNQLKIKFCVSIVAGASTPPWLIREVTKYMSETQNNANETEVKVEATLQEAANNEPQTMDELLKSNPSAGFVTYKEGKRMRGKVISADETGIHVAIGGKNDGFIPKEEASIDGNYNPADYKEGDEIQAIIKKVGGGSVTLSKKEIDAVVAEEAEAEKALSADEFSLKMTEVVKGGLRGRLGKYTIFVPASQIRIGYVSDLEKYKDTVLRLTLMPQKDKDAEAVEGEAAEAQEEKPVKKSRYLFASQRIILEREKKEKEDLFWNNIHVHDIVTGKVKRFTAFGAFVSVRGFDCLAHISELSWNKITDPSKILKIGENYDFVVLKMDRDTGKISLGYKQLQKKPYEVAAEKFPVGTVIKGKVERIFPYGAFVSIDDGVDGLVHVSQISHNWIKDANEALTVGQEVEAKIIGFDDNRITLSIKELLPAPEVAPAQEGETVEATEEEKAAKRAQRAKKFEKSADGEVKKERRGAKKESSSEPKEWVSGSSNATLGDLLGSLNLDLNDEDNK